MTTRRAVRALILTPEHECLLMKAIDPASGRAIWLTPGGGIEPGETALESLARELLEETGLQNFEPGPEIWRRESNFPWNGKVLQQSEIFYLIHTPRFVPHARGLEAGVEREGFGGFHWWTLEEIKRSPETFAPRKLAGLLWEIIYKGPPAAPIAIDL